MITKEEISKSMEEFRKTVPVINIEYPPEIELLLSMTRDEMKLKDKQELSIDASRIAQFALYMSIQANKLKSNIVWCESNIDSIVGREINNLSPKLYGWKEKSLSVIRNDQTASEMFRLKTIYETQLASILDLDRKIEYYSTTIKNLTFTKD